MKKQFISVLLAILMCVSSLTAIPVFADYPSSLSAKELLKLSLDYCNNMDLSQYIDDSAMTEYKTSLASAQSKYDASAASSELTSARDDLEKKKAALMFVQSTDPGNPLPMRDFDNTGIVKDMGIGWNLGNTMDGHGGMHPGETSWQSVRTSKALIKAVHDTGVNTVRIPVTWGDMIDDENGYAIDEAWIGRVQEIVDYCMDLGMYAIINIHHDGVINSGGWLNVASDDIDAVYEKYTCVWRNIANRFRDYDEHLIFESINEISCMDTDDSNKNSDAAKKYDVPIIMNLNQIFVNVVRSTGSNNEHRWLAVLSHFANAKDNYFKMPTDSYNTKNRLMYSAHIYKSTTEPRWEYNKFINDKNVEKDGVKSMVDGIKSMRTASATKNYPLILGEYGNRYYPLSSSDSGWNETERAWYCEIVTRACQVANVVPCFWDQGWQGEFESMNTVKGLYVIFDRAKLEPMDREITDGLARGMYLSPTSKNKNYDMSDIKKTPSITQITDITVPDSIEMTVGETKKVDFSVQPGDTNDVVLWKTDNDSVATVSNGTIVASGIGCATIHAFSQSGSVDKEIHVISKAKQSAAPAQAITTDKDEYTVVTGKYGSITASAGNGEQLYYTSSNPDVVTVNKFGRLSGINEGTAYVTITAETGLVKTVKLNVSATETTDAMNVSVHALYQDDAKKYYGTELGAPIRITGDGQYTATLDLDTEMSANGKKAGITGLVNLTAIYLKDRDVTDGNAAASPVDACTIKYDRVVVDGQELTITTPDPAGDIFNGQVFDTGGPINAWNNGNVKEVNTDKTNHVVSLTTPTSKKIEITFTLSGVHFKEEVKPNVNPVTDLVPNCETEVCARSNETVEISVKAEPKDTTEKIMFVSKNSAGVITEAISAAPDANGIAKTNIHITGLGGEITAMSENGKRVIFNIYKSVEPIIENDVITGVSGYLGDNIPEHYKVIIAVYNEDGTVSNVVPLDGNKTNIENGILTIGQLNIHINSTQTSKVFVWENTENLKPLSK